jgi:phosphate-selective porin OprO and OprP
VVKIRAIAAGLFAALLLVSASAAQSEKPPTTTADRKADKDTPKKEKKPKKAKKAKKPSDKPAPDEEPTATDTDAEPPPPDQIEPDGQGTRVTWKRHPGIRVGSMFRLDVEAKFQEDVRDTYVGDPELPRADLHRNRVGVQGYLFKHIEYEVERELTEKELDAGKTPKSPWKDVNVNLTYVKNAQVKIGKFKIPFGLDQLTGVTHNDFVYRSLGANYLAPARDIGVMVHGSFLKHGVQYWSGVFRHDGDNARSSKIEGGDQTAAARVTGTPFRAVTRGLGEIEIGGALAISKLSDDSFRPNGLRGRTIMTQHVFYEPVYVKGQRRRWEADVDWTVGPASARAEYTWVSDDRKGQGLADDDLPNAHARSWYVSGTWLLTGETKTRPVRAGGEFLQGGWGAVELAARYERLMFDSVGGTDEAFRSPRTETILPTGDRAWTLGVNWTVNRFVKVQVNGIREHVEDIERNPVPNGAAFWSRIVRLQFVL